MKSTVKPAVLYKEHLLIKTVLLNLFFFFLNVYTQRYMEKSEIIMVSVQINIFSLIV